MSAVRTTGNSTLIHAVMKEFFPMAKKDNGEYLIGSTAGDKGNSLHLCCAGPKAGLWKDFATDEGGNFTTLIMRHLGISKTKAQNWLAKFLQEHPECQYSGAPEAVAEEKFDPDQQRKLENTWDIYPATPARMSIKTPVDRYMANRGVWEGYVAAIRDGTSLRQVCEDAEPTSGEDVALFAKFDIPSGGFAIYRILVTHDGHKVTSSPPKKFLPKPCALSGGAVRLFTPTHQLAIAEGIETALAVHQLWGLPVWATCGTSFMASVEIPPSVSEVFICVDHDPSGAGRNAGEKLLKRLLGQGRTVKIIDPADYDPSVRHMPQGTDWLDILNKK
ncbi:MAG: hypothetical protein GC129_02020 [Proteobacteria bacterium]|nr:hypothetical protein [Pseudomonadota bacterium]